MKLSRTFPTWVAILALIFQGAIPLGLALPSFHSSEPLVICTQFGPRLVYPGEEPGKSRQETSDETNCAVCISVEAARLSAPSRRSGECVYFNPQTVEYFATAASLAIMRKDSRIWPRAPPFMT